MNKNNKILHFSQTVPKPPSRSLSWEFLTAAWKPSNLPAWNRQHGESIPRHSPPKPSYPSFFPNAPHPPETHQAISQTSGSCHHAPSLPPPSLCVLDMGHAPHAEQRAPREQTRAIHSSKNTARNHGCLQSLGVSLGNQPHVGWDLHHCRMVSRSKPSQRAAFGAIRHLASQPISRSIKNAHHQQITRS